MTTVDPKPELIVILCDTDGHKERACGAREATAHHNQYTRESPIAIGTPHQDAEAWFVAGCTPAPKTDTGRFAHARQVLSFRPEHEPHRLTAGPNDALTDAKRVLRFMLLNDGDQLAIGTPASRAPTSAEVETLLKRRPLNLDLLCTFQESGLTDFIEALQRAMGVAFQAHLPPKPQSA